MSAPDRDVILRAADVAKWLHVSPRHVLRLDIPRLALGHRTVLFRECDVQAWIREQVNRNGGTAA